MKFTIEIPNWICILAAYTGYTVIVAIYLALISISLTYILNQAIPKIMRGTMVMAIVRRVAGRRGVVMRKKAKDGNWFYKYLFIDQ